MQGTAYLEHVPIGLDRLPPLFSARRLVLTHDMQAVHTEGTKAARSCTERRCRRVQGAAQFNRLTPVGNACNGMSLTGVVELTEPGCWDGELRALDALRDEAGI